MELRVWLGNLCSALTNEQKNQPHKTELIQMQHWRANDLISMRFAKDREWLFFAGASVCLLFKCSSSADLCHNKWFSLVVYLFFWFYCLFFFKQHQMDYFENVRFLCLFRLVPLDTFKVISRVWAYLSVPSVLDAFQRALGGKQQQMMWHLHILENRFNAFRVSFQSKCFLFRFYTYHSHVYCRFVRHVMVVLYT